MRNAKCALMGLIVLAAVPALAIPLAENPLCQGEPQSFEQWFYQMFYC